MSYVSFAQVLENYDGQWESAKEESWLGSNNQIELKLNLNSFPKSALQIRLPAESTVFIDQKLWLLSTLDTVIYRGVEELRSEFEKDTVTFTLVSPNLSKMYGSVKKVVGADLQNELAQPSGEILSGQRFVLQPVKDFFFTGLVLILFFMALYKMAYPYMLGSCFSIGCHQCRGFFGQWESSKILLGRCPVLSVYCWDDDFRSKCTVFGGIQKRLVGNLDRP
ncbi:hypothetical protein [Algoriphagus boritolerans]|uniref:hypothetical protein n=1 Tax=Algoriphagus boritolerans TaxID=308111 RepID=UPI002FCE2C31